MHINSWTERQLWQLDTCQFETLIKARIPQLKYADGTVEELTVPLAERYSRMTTLMAAFVEGSKLKYWLLTSKMTWLF